jgi:hypothetical protein
MLSCSIHCPAARIAALRPCAISIKAIACEQVLLAPPVASAELRVNDHLRARFFS